MAKNRSPLRTRTTSSSPARPASMPPSASESTCTPAVRSALMRRSFRVDQNSRIATDEMCRRSSATPIDTDDDRFWSNIVRHRPAPLPQVDHEIERIVSHDHSCNLPALNREQNRFHRCPFAASRRKTAEILRMFPMEHEGNEATPVTVGVEREVLINQIDPVAKIGELAGEVFERLQTAYAPTRRAVEEHVVCDDRIPLREIRPLKTFVELAH